MLRYCMITQPLIQDPSAAPQPAAVPGAPPVRVGRDPGGLWAVRVFGGVAGEGAVQREVDALM